MALSTSSGGSIDASHSAGDALPELHRPPAHAPTLAEARAYCEQVTRGLYEKLPVRVWLLPKPLRPHLASISAYCRISSALTDEVVDPQIAVALLNHWESELDRCYDSLRGDAEPPLHPLFVALRETVRDLDIPRKPFADLLSGARQDHLVRRYRTFEELLGYCAHSANPVGRLVLYAWRYRDEERQHLSDFACAALRLANLWQDVAADYAAGHLYLPAEDMQRFGVPEEVIAGHAATPQFVGMMRFEVERTREWLGRGLALAGKVDRALAVEVELFTRWGQEILHGIERQGFDVLTRCPAVSNSRRLALVLAAAARKVL